VICLLWFAHERDALTKQMLSEWIVESISLANEASGQPSLWLLELIQQGLLKFLKPNCQEYPFKMCVM